MTTSVLCFLSWGGWNGTQERCTEVNYRVRLASSPRGEEAGLEDTKLTKEQNTECGVHILLRWHLYHLL